MILFTINCDPRIQFATIMRRPIACSTSGTKKSTVVVVRVVGVVGVLSNTKASSSAGTGTLIIVDADDPDDDEEEDNGGCCKWRRNPATPTNTPTHRSVIDTVISCCCTAVKMIGFRCLFCLLLLRPPGIRVVGYITTWRHHCTDRTIHWRTVPIGTRVYTTRTSRRNQDDAATTRMVSVGVVVVTVWNT